MENKKELGFFEYLFYVGKYIYWRIAYRKEIRERKQKELEKKNRQKSQEKEERTKLKNSRKILDVAISGVIPRNHFKGYDLMIRVQCDPESITQHILVKLTNEATKEEKIRKYSVGYNIDLDESQFYTNLLKDVKSDIDQMNNRWAGIAD